MPTLRSALLAFVFVAALPLPLAAQAPSTTPHQLFVIVYRPGPAWIAGRPMAEQDLRPHGLYYRRLLDQGRIFAGGGFVGTDGGLAIVRAATLQEAQAMLADDPAIQSGVFAAELRQWSPRFVADQPLVDPAR